MPIAIDDAMPDGRVFDWLGQDENGVGYYLHPLNLVWSPKGAEHDLERFADVARRLAGDSEYWSEIIRTPAWRHTLVGCVCTVLTARSDRFDDLSYRFERGSFVSPQVCLAMGLVDPDATRSYLADLMARDAIFGSKELGAAQAVLWKLGHAEPVEKHRAGEATLGSSVVADQWEFWRGRAGSVA